MTHDTGVDWVGVHVLITAPTKATRAAASNCWVKNTLPVFGIGHRVQRSARLGDLVGTINAKLVAHAYGMTSEAFITYLTEHVDPARLPIPRLVR